MRRDPFHEMCQLPDKCEKADEKKRERRHPVMPCDRRDSTTGIDPLREEQHPLLPRLLIGPHGRIGAVRKTNYEHGNCRGTHQSKLADAATCFQSGPLADRGVRRREAYESFRELG